MPIRLDQMTADEKIALAVLSLKAMHPDAFLDLYWQALQEGAPSVGVSRKLGPAEEALQKRDAGAAALTRLSHMGLAQNIGYNWTLTGAGQDAARELTRAAGASSAVARAAEGVRFSYEERVISGRRYAVIYAADGLARLKPVAEWAGDRWVPTPWAAGHGLLDEGVLSALSLPRPGQLRPGTQLGKRLIPAAAFLRAVADDEAAAGHNPAPR
jgi:hypothetical protein